MPTLGEELKRLREEKGFTIRDVSDATHIGGRFLQSIESDNYSILPGGIFNRGFVRSYARFVGMDEEQALVMYGQQLELQGGEAPRTLATSMEGIDEEVSSPWGSIALIVIILLLLSAGIFTAYRWFKASEVIPPVAISSTPNAATSATPDDGLAPSPTASGASTQSPAPASSVGASPSHAASGSPLPGAAIPAPPLTGALQLKLQAKDGECWIKVRADANPKSEMVTLKPGEIREISGNDRLIINIGNVMTLDAYLNGRPIRITANKGKFIAESVVITKENYQQFIQ